LIAGVLVKGGALKWLNTLTRNYTVSQKGSPTLSIIVTWIRIIRFQYFSVRVFLTRRAIKWLFTFPPHPASASAPPAKSRTSKICVGVNKKRQKKHSRHYRL